MEGTGASSTCEDAHLTDEDVHGSPVGESGEEPIETQAEVGPLG